MRHRPGNRERPVLQARTARCGTACGDAAQASAAQTTFTPALVRLSAVVILGATMTILDTTIVNVAIDTLGRDLDVSVATIQWSRPATCSPSRW